MSGATTARKRSPSLEGARVWVTGKRKADAMARILEGHGASTTVVPTLETRVDEDPIWRKRQARKAAEAEPEVAVFLTGIGGRLLFESAREAGVFERLRRVLEAAFVTARGPKARSALLGAEISVDAEPAEATGAAVLDVLRGERARVEGAPVLVQRHGRPDRDLEEGIRELGGRLVTVDLYRYAPPPDLPALRRALAGCAEGELDGVVFTSPPAVRGLMRAAAETGQADDLRHASRRGLIVAAVGGSTAGALRDGGVEVEVVPEDFTQPSLARALARRWQARRSGEPEAARERDAGTDAGRRPEREPTREPT